MSKLLALSGLIVLLVIAHPSVAETQSSNDAPLPVTIEDIKKAPRTYDKKLVRIRGQIDNCFDFTCNLCPEDFGKDDSVYERCLGVEFDDFGGYEEPLMELFRFATVTLDTTFDSRCMGLPESDVVCLDRAPVLLKSHVQTVHSRKSALDGIVSWYDYGPLTEASQEERDGMHAELYVDGEQEYDDIVTKFFHVPGHDDTGMYCDALKDEFDGRWPTEFFYGLSSPANKFHCTMMRKTPKGWRRTMAP